MSDFANDTIVAISTPPGRGGIGIVRLSGPRARAVAEPLLRLRHALAAGRARFAEILDIEKKDKTRPGNINKTRTGNINKTSLGNIDKTRLEEKESASGEREAIFATEDQAVLDEAVVTYFAAPNSYTGEDIVEIAAHGSPVLLDYLLRACIANGARLAEPGEFTQRAFLAGRLDLTQAEAVHDLIESTTLHQARVAAQQLGGGLSRQVAPIKEKLVHLIAALEAGIDFAEDDIDLLPASAITAQIAAIEAPLAALEQTFAYGRIVRDGLTLAIVGRPNAGKSSLFNRLVERDRAIVTATPGTTRDLVTERVSLEGIPLELVDTAGLRDAIDEAESIGITKSREVMAEADLVLLVLDATAPLHPEDEAAIAAHTTRPLLIAWNKRDLAPGVSLPEQGHSVIATSALTGEGIVELRRAIVALIANAAPSSETALLTNLRQQQAVAATLAALARARSAVAVAIPHEMLLLDLYEALAALDGLTGVTTTEDILRLIFSTFCIGK